MLERKTVKTIRRLANNSNFQNNNNQNNNQGIFAQSKNNNNKKPTMIDLLNDPPQIKKLNNSFEKEEEDKETLVYKGNTSHIGDLTSSQVDSMLENITNILPLLLKQKKVLQEKELSEKKSTNKRLCTICFEKEISILFLPCCHLCCCEVCNSLMINCPICQKKISNKIKVFQEFTSDN